MPAHPNLSFSSDSYKFKIPKNDLAWFATTGYQKCDCAGMGMLNLNRNEVLTKMQDASAEMGQESDDLMWVSC